MAPPARILVVDDDAHAAAIVSRALCRQGHEVAWVSDPAAIWTALALRPPEVVVLDLLMPGVNGWEVIRRLRGRFGAMPVAGSEHTRILVVSGREDPETRDFVRRLGADAYLTKPLQPRALVRAVEDLLARRRASSSGV